MLEEPWNQPEQVLSWETHVARTWMRATKATRVQKGQGWGLCSCRAACSKPRAPVRTG